jgi:hypothetical protein
MNPTRGDYRQTKGGAMGWYVGTSPAGVEWWAYRQEEFEPLCQTFDSRK